MEERINGLSPETDPHPLASGISNTLFDACESADIQPIKTKTYSTGNKPWFDKDCQRLKNSIKKNCKKLRSTRSSPDVQQQITLDIYNII